MVDKAQKWPRAFASHLEKSNYFVTDFTALSVSSSIWPSLLKAGLGQFTKFDRGVAIGIHSVRIPVSFLEMSH